MGLHIIVYIYDGINISASAAVSEAEGTQDIVVSDHDRAGFVLNVIKTHLDPVQIINCLGFVIDLREGSVSVPQHKIVRLKSAITNVPILGAITAHSLASIVGQIISMSLAIGPVSRLQTRALYILSVARYPIILIEEYCCRIAWGTCI